MGKQKHSSQHKVNVFHLISFYRFFHISCKDCKLKTHCESVKHKGESCKIVQDTRKLLAQYAVGYVSSFDSDDFYIKSVNIVQNQETKKLLSKIWSKYAVKTK